jgi:G3E family GTPase
LIRLLRNVDTARFDAVVIETTGLADPRPIAAIFHSEEDIKEIMYLKRVVTVVDSRHILGALNDVRPSGTLNEAEAQLVFADIVLVNKVV